jgi:hypothetical protein
MTSGTKSTETSKTSDALQQLARGLETYIMNNRDGDAFDLAMLIDNLIKERVTPDTCNHPSSDGVEAWKCSMCGELREKEPHGNETGCALCAEGMNSFIDPDTGNRMHARNGTVTLCSALKAFACPVTHVTCIRNCAPTRCAIADTP